MAQRELIFGQLRFKICCNPNIIKRSSSSSSKQLSFYTQVSINEGRGRTYEDKLLSVEGGGATRSLTIVNQWSLEVIEKTPDNQNDLVFKFEMFCTYY